MTSKILKKLKEDMHTKEIIEKTSGKSTVSNKKHEFAILPDTCYISLTTFQQKQLLKSLEIYFPNLYVELVFTKRFNIETEEGLEKFLSVLDDEMSEQKHHDNYKDCYVDEYNFLRQLRLKHMTKK